MAEHYEVANVSVGTSIIVNAFTRMEEDDV